MNTIPIVQLLTGIPKKYFEKVFILSLTEELQEFRDNALLDTVYDEGVLLCK